MCAADRGDGIGNIGGAGEDGRREFLVQVTRRICRPFRSLPPGGHAHGLLDGLLGRAVASHRVCQQILLRGLALVVVGKRRDGHVQKPDVVSLLDTGPVRPRRVARGGANDLDQVGQLGVALANDRRGRPFFAAAAVLYAE